MRWAVGVGAAIMSAIGLVLLFLLTLAIIDDLVAVLIIALFLLGSATVGIALLPGYASLGNTAIVWLVGLRIAQGLAVGGSWDGLPSLLALNVPEERRGWWSISSLSLRRMRCRARQAGW